MDARRVVLGMVVVSLVGCPDTTVVVGGSTSTETGTTDTPSTTETGDGDGDGGDVVEDHRTFFIGESTDFDGGGLCDNAGVNTVTNSLREALVDAGWTGLRFVNEDSWPEDFREGTSSNLFLDGTYGDAARLSVYAGHGNVGMLQWGQPSDNGLCQNFISKDSRLGTLAGDTAAATMLMTSCTMRVDQLWPVFKDQAGRQFFGYHNSPHIGHNEARKVFERSQDGQPTADAWLEEMVLNVSGKNSPVVFTMGTSPDDAATTHGMTNLASGEGFIQNVGEPANFYHFVLFDSGCTEVCGNCPDNAAPPPDLMLAPSVSRVKLTRPVRSANDLVTHTSSYLSHFDVGQLDEMQQERLETWAATIVETGDVTYTQLLDEPRIDVSYDPSSDLLRITNRDALAHATPSPEELVDDPANLRESLQFEAGALRDELQPLEGALDMLGAEFDLMTREVGSGGGAGPQIDPVAIEYLFTLPGVLEDFALPDRHLTIGLTRLGELSTLAVSMIDVEVLDAVEFQRSPQQALDTLESAVFEQHPSASAVEFVAPVIGYQLNEDETSNVVTPSLLVGYVLAFGPADDLAVSRRFPVRISLTNADAAIESLAAVDPTAPGADHRAAN